MVRWPAKGQRKSIPNASEPEGIVYSIFIKYKFMILFLICIHTTTILKIKLMHKG